MSLLIMMKAEDGLDRVGGLMDAGRRVLVDHADQWFSTGGAVLGLQ